MKLTDKILMEAGSYRQRFSQASRQLNKVLDQIKKALPHLDVIFVPAEDRGQENLSSPPYIEIGHYFNDSRETHAKVNVLFSLNEQGLGQWEAYSNINSDMADTDYDNIVTRSLTEVIEFASDFINNAEPDGDYEDDDLNESDDKLEEGRYQKWSTEAEEITRNHSWQAFLNQFNAKRKTELKSGNPEWYAMAKRSSQGEQKITFQQPTIRFVDEYAKDSLETYSTPDSTRINSYKDVDGKGERISFEGLKNADFGDIIVSFRGGDYHFKAVSKGDTITYKYASSAAHRKHDNMWPDQALFQNMIKGLTLTFNKHEVPVIYRQNTPSKNRPTTLDTERGYSKVNRKPGVDSKYYR